MQRPAGKIQQYRDRFGVAGFLIFGIAPTGSWFWLGIPVMSIWGVAGAATQALMTRLVAPDQQGQLQGALEIVAMAQAEVERQKEQGGVATAPETQPTPRPRTAR